MSFEEFEIKGHPVRWFRELPSTNTYLKEHPELLGKAGQVVVTSHQTAGRGRRGRLYWSLPGKNLTFSLVLHPECPQAQLTLYALWSGIAVVRSLEVLGVTPRLKWPNDVLIGNRKVCGILAESVWTKQGNRPALILGIGINVLGQPQEFPAELWSMITTVAASGAKEVTPETLLPQVLQALDAVDRQFREQGMATLREEWLQRSGMLGNAVRFEQQEGWKTGVVAGIGPEGALLLELTSGEVISHISGDVEWTNKEE
ncbi:MAG: biotin--[acetyl-CoA-carboxylase] ligase [Deltaproteobacteria bacterium]|nr:biotin--[acetyl-CoA-carboxylase] ligase [Deltaproteobacteria bacterium]